jgi:ABC-type multidrug transport system fused ATPase/permease subunit
VAENVAFSQWGKPYDEGRVKDACRMAALDLVETHPLGINIPIGERGTGISGGQAQRVCIARVLFANPELLILDEATSSLDQGAEAAIVETVSRFRGRLTTVVIAHRLSTVKHCDHVIWIDEGRIVDQGDPQSILPKYEQSLKKIA